MVIIRQVLLVAAVLAMTASAAVVTWNPACQQYQSPGCWSTGRAPQVTDSIVFPNGTDVLFFGIGSSAPGYVPIEAATLNISKGAVVRMTNNELAITGDVFVDGTLLLDCAETPGVGPIGPYNYPQRWDASNAFYLGGFTPRLLQLKGMLYISGTVLVYSTEPSGADYPIIWTNVTVNAGGNLNMSYGYLAGTLANAGTVTMEYAYFSSPVINKGAMAIQHLEVSPFAAPTNMFITNYGELQVMDVRCIQDAGSFSIINHGTANIYMRAGGLGSSLVNTGALTVSATECTPGAFLEMFTVSSIVNNGTIIICAAIVNTYSYVSNGGQVKLVNGGKLVGGSGAPKPPNFRFECATSASTGEATVLEVRAAQAAVGQARCNPKNASSCSNSSECCDATGTCVVSACDNGCCPSNDKCDYSYLVPLWLTNAYCPPSPYSASTPPAVPVPCQFKLAFGDGFDVHTQLLSPAHAITKHLAFFGTSTITSDGTGGSLVLTEPAQLEGVLNVMHGATVTLVVEFGQQATVGGGEIVVHAGGRLVAGVDGAFDRHGRVSVQTGGLVLVPRHATFAITNASTLHVAGGRLHVDGELSLAAEYGDRDALVGEGIVRFIK